MRKSRRRFPRGRKRRVVWFVPRTSGAANTADAAESCWAEVPSLLAPYNAVPAPPVTVLQIPLVWNLTESLDPTVTPSMTAHPLSERWRVERIVGQVLLATQHNPSTNPSIITGGIAHLGIVRNTTIDDGIVDLNPADNANAGRSWLWLQHVLLADDHTACFPCPIDCIWHDDQGCHHESEGANASYPLSASQIFGYPTARMIDVDVRVKRNIGPEDVLSLHVSFEQAVFGDTPVVELGVTPKLRVLLSRTV